MTRKGFFASLGISLSWGDEVVWARERQDGGGKPSDQTGLLNGVESTESADRLEVMDVVPGSSGQGSDKKREKRRVSISMSAESPEKDPERSSDFERKRKAHYSGEFQRTALGDKYYLRKRGRRNRRHNLTKRGQL
eukprot:sb/3474627/